MFLAISVGAAGKPFYQHNKEEKYVVDGFGDRQSGTRLSRRSQDSSNAIVTMNNFLRFRDSGRTSSFICFGIFRCLVLLIIRKFFAYPLTYKYNPFLISIFTRKAVCNNKNNHIYQIC
jgi:hypothetical protein